MPGKYIDRTAVTLTGAAAFYLFFLNAWNSIPLAICAAFLCCAVIRALAKRRPAYFKCSVARANSDILSIAAMDDTEAESVLSGLIRRRYPDEAFTLAPFLKYPTATLSPGDVFALWKKHRSAEKLLIACTCPADPRAIMYARELTSPRVAVFDSRRLRRAIRLTGPVIAKAPAEPLLRRIRRIPGNIAMRACSPRNALSGVALTALFILTGNYIYLFAGLTGLFLFCYGLPRTGFRRSLFR